MDIPVGRRVASGLRFLVGAMHDTDPEFIKEREIHFAGGVRDSATDEAASMLLDVPGIDRAESRSENRLWLRYDLRRVSLEMIEDALTELGFELDDGIVARVQRVLVHYSEETQRANSDVEYSWAPRTRDAFVKAYERRPHGCRDGRPPYWRRYL